MADVPKDEDFDIDAEVSRAIEETEAFPGVFLSGDIVHALSVVLKHYATLTVYVIEPYISQNEGEPLKIPAGDNYSIYDYGGRLVATANDIWTAPFLASGELLAACEHMLQILLDASATEIAVLGDSRAKLFVWDMCDRLNKAKSKKMLEIINFTPDDAFLTTREAVLRYLQDRGMQPKIRPGSSPTAAPTV